MQLQSLLPRMVFCRACVPNLVIGETVSIVLLMHSAVQSIAYNFMLSFLGRNGLAKC